VYPGAFTDSANKKIAEEKKKIKVQSKGVTPVFPSGTGINGWTKTNAPVCTKAESNAPSKDLFATADMVRTK
jgi:hypothetical protein